MGLRIGGEIEKVNGGELSYSDFVERYLMKNQPVVLRGLMDGWRACKDWVTHTGQPNLNFFSTNFGKSIVQVFNLSSMLFFFDLSMLNLNFSTISLFLILYPLFGVR